MSTLTTDMQHATDGQKELTPILDVRNLSVKFRTPNGMVTAVNDVSFTINQGETVALVGESGSGKSVTSLAIMRLTPPAPRAVLSGEVHLRDANGDSYEAVSASERQMRALRGGVVSMVFQEPMTSFNPLHTIGNQISEGVRLRHGLSKKAAADRAAELLELVGITDPLHRLANYPHELSGGMRQRAMIAMALSGDPALLIADEPTTALDVTIQAQILELLQELQAKTNMAMLFITHNLGVVAEVADRVMVMYSGRIVEKADVVTLFKKPRMPYTVGLLKSVPKLSVFDGHQKPLPAIRGNVPSPFNLPAGCSFSERCDYSRDPVCTTKVPPLEAIGEQHSVRCARWRELSWE